ncbi:hypothetical protein [Micromonospora sp. DT227]|uniref:hypothetical protein n=1 Tax=Micromonospora sp. DT227 TaxID=3393433 RepID=UPI003CF5C1A5
MTASDDTVKTQMRAVVTEVQRVHARVSELAGVAGSAKETAEAAQAAVTRLAEELVNLARDMEQAGGDLDGEVEKVVPGLSWLTVSDPDDARKLMRGFPDWLANVYCRWQEKPLPDCWAWHPAVVAELLALRDAWNDAVNPAAFSAARAMDWVDRYRPATARRIAKELTNCSLTAHTADKPTAYRPPQVHGADMLDQLTDWWWQTGGRETAPGPDPAMLAAVKARAAADDDL